MTRARVRKRLVSEEVLAAYNRVTLLLAEIRDNAEFQANRTGEYLKHIEIEIRREQLDEIREALVALKRPWA